MWKDEGTMVDNIWAAGEMAGWPTHVAQTVNVLELSAE